MKTNASKREKTAVEYLKFGKRTAKRVAWEAWEFAVVGPHQVRVTNASYGYLKDEHAYTVGIKERDGIAVPAECGCPADLYNEEYDCKHKVALATIGGATVMDASLGVEAPRADTTTTTDETLRDRLDDSPTREGCPHGDKRCGGPAGDVMPCFECFDAPTEPPAREA